MKRALEQAVLAASVVLVACASRAGVDPRAAAPEPAAGAAHQHEDPAAAAAQHQHGEPPAAGGGAGFTAADVRFMQEMIGHHDQALLMAAMVPTRAAWVEVVKLAEKIDISQRDEIAMMRAWLTERKQPVPEGAHAHTQHMPGMLTDAQLAQLEAARGAEFDRLFLRFMIQHHRGALVMVDALFASPGAGQDPDIFRFATDVATDQLDEIDVMSYMLEILPANRGSQSR